MTETHAAHACTQTHTRICREREQRLERSSGYQKVSSLLKLLMCFHHYYSTFCMVSIVTRACAYRGALSVPGGVFSLLFMDIEEGHSQ